MTHNEILKVIEELNEWIFETFDETEMTFNYATNGFVDIIKFENIILWNSEDDEREYDDFGNYEPMVPFIKQQLSDYIDNISRFKPNAVEVNLSDITRVEVIDEEGRSYVNWSLDNRIDMDFQDMGRTLKIFITKNRNED